MEQFGERRVKLGLDGGGLEMSESEEQRNDSPLLSDRGVTMISDTVVSQVAGMAAQEVEGVHMGGGTSRSAGGVLGSITGSESNTSGISVEVGRTETAIDLKMGIEYDKNILQTVEEVRRRITDRVEQMTGPRIKELNATITDITFPEKEARRRPEPARSTSEPDDSPEEATETAPETQATPEDAASEPGESETTQVEATDRTEDSSVPEEGVGTEDRPPEAEATTEVRADEASTEQPAEEAAETSETAETDGATETTEIRAEIEQESAEARMRRRAEERARRRRRRSQDS
jgi:uncharacterized alkaline shock family protein YloU